MTTEKDENSATETLRRALAVRVKLPGDSLRLIAANVEGLALVDLQDFAAGRKASLPPPIIRSVAAELYGNAAITFDVQTDRFHQPAPPMLPTPVQQSNFDPKSSPTFHPQTLSNTSAVAFAPRPMKPSPKTTASAAYPPQRRGFA